MAVGRSSRQAVEHFGATSLETSMSNVVSRPQHKSTRILLVESDDDLCLWLWHGIAQASGLSTITSSIVGAGEMLRRPEDFHSIVTNASLADGSGFVLVDHAVAAGLPFLLTKVGVTGSRFRTNVGLAFEETRAKSPTFSGRFYDANPANGPFS